MFTKMAAPLCRDILNRVIGVRGIIFRDSGLLPCQYIACKFLHHHISGSLLLKGPIPEKPKVGSGCALTNSPRPVQSSVLSNCNIPARCYGRKIKPKPPKITHFEYSGDLRNLPELDKNTLLYSYAGLEDQLEGNEVLKQLSSLEFASGKEFAHHRRELIRDRIVDLFGPDSEMEQQIALLTLGIRQMIPYCISYRKDKYNKIWLLKRIFRRRRLLTKLRELDHERFEWLLRELKIRYVIPRDREEFKGWKHNLRVATQEEALTKKRQKLESLRAKFEEEKKAFFEHKAQVLADIHRDLAKFGLSQDFLEELQKEAAETKGTDPSAGESQTEQKPRT